MAMIQVRDVPDDVQADFVRRAKQANQSSQQYLRSPLAQQARRPDPVVFWAEIGQRVREDSAVHEMSDAVQDVRSLREQRR